MKNITKFAVSFVAVAALFVAANAQAYTHMGTLKMGSTGSQVMELQKALNAKGFVVSSTGLGSAGNESTYFGAKTKGAVVAFQTANGLGKDGVVGPATGAALASGSSTGGTSTVPGCTAGAMFSSTTGASCTGGSTSTGPLAGTAGNIDNTSKISSYNDEEVGEGSSDVKVVGFEIETSNDGDIALRSMKLEFDPAAHSGSQSTHLDDYIDGVSIWMGSTKIGSADVSDFSENSDIYTRTITLSNAVVRSDMTEKFYITVDAVNNLDSGDVTGDNWSLDVTSIRFEDGSGVVSTYDSDTDTLDTQLDFVDFGTAADSELKFSTASDNPEAGIVNVNESSVKDNIVLLKGKITLDGDSDVNIDELPFTFSPVGDNMNAIVDSITLVIDGEEYSESVPSIADAASGTITFDNLDFDMNAGDTINFEIIADINGTDDYTEGDSITASFTSTNRDYVDAENEEGDQLDDSDEKSGTATGKSQEFRSNGVELTFVSATTNVAAGTSANDDQGTFTIKFKVKAIGDTVYISSLADAKATAGVTAGKTSMNIDRAGTATNGGTSTVLTNLTSTTLTSVGLYQLDSGEENTFEISSTVQLPTAGAAGLFRAVLGGVSWTTTSTDNTPDNAYTSNLDSFKTSYIGLN